HLLFPWLEKERVAEVKKELDVLSALPDQILEVELLKMPMSIRQMKVSEYYKLMEANKMDAAVKVDALDDLPEVKLVRKNSRKAKEMTSADYREPVGCKVMSTLQRNRTVQKVPKSKSLVSLTGGIEKRTIAMTRSISATPLNKAPKKMMTSVSSTRLVSRTSRNAVPPPSRSSRNGGFSSLSDNLTLYEGLPFIQIPLTDGQTLSSAFDDLETLDVELLRHDTVQHIHTLVGQLTNLYTKASTQQQGSGHGQGT
ncbi:borealin-2-like, partial [Pseudophryne corroboree]|uniref:borealin-2-like n=1 Tax=Pseudophryne corroboree TaxID=495146 RepID=UPI00308144CC